MNWCKKWSFSLLHGLTMCTLYSFWTVEEQGQPGNCLMPCWSTPLPCHPAAARPPALLLQRHCNAAGGPFSSSSTPFKTPIQGGLMLPGSPLAASTWKSPNFHLQCVRHQCSYSSFQFFQYLFHHLLRELALIGKLKRYWGSSGIYFHLCAPKFHFFLVDVEQNSQRLTRLPFLW